MIDILKKATYLNRNEPCRRGSTLMLPEHGKLIVSGDIHGNRANYDCIVKCADLANNPDTHIIFQEIIHGGPEDEFGGCLSFELVAQSAELKIQFPDQVHFILGNHDTSVILGTDVLKNGKEMNRALFAAIDRKFKDNSNAATLALKQFLFSQALAARTHTGILIAHSLPADMYIDNFDAAVLDRDLQINDIIRPNSAYLMTWGRRHSQEVLTQLGEMLSAELFILGHQRQEQGFSKAGDNLLILASDHSNGVFLKIDLATKYTVDELIECIDRLACMY